MGEVHTFSRSGDMWTCMIKWTKAKVHVYSDSVSCLGEMPEHSEANQRSKNQLEEFRQSNSYRELFRIDGEPIQFEWKIFPRRTSLEIFRKIQKDLQDRNIEPENFEDRIIFMSMFNDIDWTKRGNTETCISNTGQFKNCAKQFSQGHRTFLSPGYENKWYGNLSYTHEGTWDSIATQIVGRFKATRHPVVKSISALSRGILKRKKNRDTVHINADASNAELLFRTIHSALSIYGAVSSWCGESAQRTPSPQEESTREKFVAKEVNSLVQTPRSDNWASGNRLRECLQRCETLEKDFQCTELFQDEL